MSEQAVCEVHVYPPIMGEGEISCVECGYTVEVSFHPVVSAPWADHPECDHPLNKWHDERGCLLCSCTKHPANEYASQEARYE